MARPRVEEPRARQCYGSLRARTSSRTMALARPPRPGRGLPPSAVQRLARGRRATPRPPGGDEGPESFDARASSRAAIRTADSKLRPDDSARSRSAAKRAPRRQLPTPRAHPTDRRSATVFFVGIEGDVRRRVPEAQQLPRLDGGPCRTPHRVDQEPRTRRCRRRRGRTRRRALPRPEASAGRPAMSPYASWMVSEYGSAAS